MNKENPTLTLLKQALPEGFDLDSIKKIVSIFSVEYTEASLKKLKKSILENKLEGFTKSHNFDSLKNAIQLLLFINKDETRSMCILFCPVELYENEYIIDVIKFPFDFDETNFKEAETIFQSTD